MKSFKELNAETRELNEGFNEDQVTELQLYIENDGQLYRSRTTPIQKNLSKKYKAGKYDSKLAIKIWLPLAKEGAKGYDKEFGSRGSSIFSKGDIQEVAIRLRDDWEAEMEAGNFMEETDVQNLDEARKRKKKAAKRRKAGKRKAKKKLRKMKRKKKKVSRKARHKIDKKRAIKVAKAMKSKWNKKFGQDDRTKALAEFLDLEVDDDEIESGWDDVSFEADGGEYLVLTDDEADTRLRDYIEETLWAFNNDFLANFIDAEDIVRYEGLETSFYDEDTEEEVELDDEETVDQMYGSVNDWIKEQQGRYEDGNQALLNVIDNMDGFVRDAEMSDGRGHFLSSYDGDENEQGNFYIYRIN